MQEDLSVEVQALEHVVADAQARRELLWLRAKEKGDAWTISDLKRADPEIEERLQAAQGPFDDQADFGRLYDQCLDRHLRRFTNRKSVARQRARRARL